MVYFYCKVIIIIIIIDVVNSFSTFTDHATTTAAAPAQSAIQLFTQQNQLAFSEHNFLPSFRLSVSSWCTISI